MNESDIDLLGRFARDRSEDAFAELVARHLPLVFSAALRQMDGDAASAEEVAQAVFTDLARKAADLTSHSSLTGWLYTGTRHLASNARRSEQRRRQREQQAHAMNSLFHDAASEVDWNELRPVLDNAMHELGESDREALLLRYFERRPLAEVGSRLGLGENAARMRVDRAMERLRQVLARRGITSVGAALAASLATKVVADLPPGLASRIVPAAIQGAAVGTGSISGAGAGAGSATGTGLIFSILVLMTRNQLKLIVAAALLALLVLPVRQMRLRSEARRADEARARVEAVAAAAVVAPQAVTPPRDSGETVVAAGTNDTLRRLKLTLLTADSGQPIPGAVVERGWVTEASFVSLRDGTVPVTFPKSAKELRLTTRVEGFADTCLKWSQERGDKIPESYLLKLERAVELGGLVVDPDGNPLPGAKIGIGYQADPALNGRVETHEFGYIETTSDTAGRWRVHRIAVDMLQRVGFGASHPEFTRVGVELASDKAAENAMRAGTYVFKLGRAITVSGIVVDSDGRPIADAQVLVGLNGEVNSRKSKSGDDGRFSVRGCLPGKQLLSAQAKGYAATTEEVEVKDGAGPFRLVLRRGNPLRLRVVNKDGAPIAKANLWLDTLSRDSGDGKPGAAPVQTELELKSDAEGRASWDEAPDSDLKFAVAAKGYMYLHDYQVHPDGKEHVITLDPALTISGTVVDSKSGVPVQKFRIITGWPQKDFGTGTTNPVWSPIDRFWLPFSGGTFRHVFEEAVLGGLKNPGYVFKFEAEGYAPLVTRVVAADEGEARFDIRLRPAAETTVTVVTPQGRIAPNAQVALVPARGRARLKGTGFDTWNGRGSLIVTTDARGQFKLPEDETLARVVVAHSEGFGDASPAELKSGTPTLALMPWGRIEGKWFTAGKPSVGSDLIFENPEGPDGFLEFEFSSFKRQTDAEGRFVFEQVPPGRFNLVRLVRGPEENAYSHGRKTEVNVRPGEVTPVTLGLTGYVVTARLVPAAGVDASLNWRRFGVIQSPMPEIPAEVKADREALQRWWQTPEHQRLQRSRKVFPMNQTEDGSIRVEEVDPGTFVFQSGAFLVDAQGKPVARLQGASQPITIPETPATGAIDLGVITLQPETPPR